MLKKRTGRPLPMVLLLIPFLYFVFSSPLSEPAQTILELVYLSIMLGITVLVVSRNADEVEVTTARFSVSIGAYAGIACTIGLLLVMTRVPAVAEVITSLAESLSNDLSPAVAGFGLGALAAIALMFISGTIIYTACSWRYAR